MSNIEEGCMAIIVGGSKGFNAGKIVQVGMFIGKVNHCKHDNIWEVDKPITYTTIAGIDSIRYDCPEHCLHRIDEEDLSINNTTENLCRVE